MTQDGALPAGDGVRARIPGGELGLAVVDLDPGRDFAAVYEA